ncbi:MAG: polyprenyl synthetase family protein [Acetobacter sp.]|nr:polyprenyl synthetase family protein [Acetobacter sp.]
MKQQTEITPISPVVSLLERDTTLLLQDLEYKASLIEKTIDALLPLPAGKSSRLFEAMRYATLGGGKRLRGYLVLSTAQLFDVPIEQAVRVAASVEMLHAYSLVHDDLPAMDNDDMRRGKPSTHRKFDEATAILAGDALQTMAFDILASDQTHPDDRVRVELIKSFADACGAYGMVGGQMIDMESEGCTLSLDETRHLHALKTGCLIRYAAESGAILGRSNSTLRQCIRSYGTHIGAAFQIADDILDVTATTKDLGKTVGKDDTSGKSTFVSLLNIEGARLEAVRLVEKAITDISSFGHAADRLRDLACYIINRKY